MRSLALAVVLVLAVPAAGANAEVPARSVQAPGAGDLFVLTAAGGQLEPVRGRERVFRLVLRRPARDVTGFSDRPARTTGQQPLARFVRRWASLGFAEVPPNAALVLADAPSSRDVLVVELSRPRLGTRGRTLSFRAELLRDSSGGRLRGFARRADRRIAARFGRVSLFIDPGGQEVGLLFTLSNIPPSGLASIAFNNSAIDLADDLFVDADGPAKLTAAPGGFVLAASGSSPVSASVQVGTTVVAGADCAQVNAILTAGTSATVRVLGTSRTLPVTNGRLCIPFS